MAAPMKCVFVPLQATLAIEGDGLLPHGYVSVWWWMYNSLEPPDCGCGCVGVWVCVLFVIGEAAVCRRVLMRCSARGVVQRSLVVVQGVRHERRRPDVQRQVLPRSLLRPVVAVKPASRVTAAMCGGCAVFVL